MGSEVIPGQSVEGAWASGPHLYTHTSLFPCNDIRCNYAFLYVTSALPADWAANRAALKK